jgi:hypothetical protein
MYRSRTGLHAGLGLLWEEKSPFGSFGRVIYRSASWGYDQSKIVALGTITEPLQLVQGHSIPKTEERLGKSMRAGGFTIDAWEVQKAKAYLAELLTRSVVITKEDMEVLGKENE